MGGNTAIVEGGLGIIDDLAEDEGLVLLARRERSVERGIAQRELGRLGDGMRTRSPNELDGIANRGVGSERHVAKDTLGRSNDDSVSDTVGTSATCSSICRGRSDI